MLVITGTHLGVLFHHQGDCKLGNKCAFKHIERAGGHNSVVIAKTLDLSQTEDLKTSLTSQRRETLCTVCQRFRRNHPLFLKKNGKTIVQRFRLSRVSERYAKKCEKEGHTSSTRSLRFFHHRDALMDPSACRRLPHPLHHPSVGFSRSHHRLGLKGIHQRVSLQSIRNICGP